jgi:hypothetical protein
LRVPYSTPLIFTSIVAVAVERHAFNAKKLATAAKFGGMVIGI